MYCDAAAATAQPYPCNFMGLGQTPRPVCNKEAHCCAPHKAQHCSVAAITVQLHLAARASSHLADILQPSLGCQRRAVTIKHMQRPPERRKASNTGAASCNAQQLYNTVHVQVC
jgi:hypothetical protein